jgi:hypothetical protein
MDRIARGNHHERARHADAGKQVKEQRDNHTPVSALSIVMPGLVPVIHVFIESRGWPGQARP